MFIRKATFAYEAPLCFSEPLSAVDGFYSSVRHRRAPKALQVRLGNPGCLPPFLLGKAISAFLSILESKIRLLQDIGAYAGKILIHLCICVSQNTNSQRPKLCISFSILFEMIFKAMLSAVKLDCNFLLLKEKVYNIVPNVFLPFDRNR